MSSGSGKYGSTTKPSEPNVPISKRPDPPKYRPRPSSSKIAAAERKTKKASKWPRIICVMPTIKEE